LLCAVARAQDDARASFEGDLEKVRRAVARSSWDIGRRDLKRLLDDHAEKPYAIAHAAEIADLMKNCVFRDKHGVPSTTDVLAGSIISYNRVTGKL
jgi:hypothetical protein